MKAPEQQELTFFLNTMGRMEREFGPPLARPIVIGFSRVLGKSIARDQFQVWTRLCPQDVLWPSIISIGLEPRMIPSGSRAL